MRKINNKRLERTPEIIMVLVLLYAFFMVSQASG